LKKRITSIGAARLINQNTAASSGGVAVKRAFTMKDAKLESMIQEILMMMRINIVKLI